jgi:hypothetical protein
LLVLAFARPFFSAASQDSGHGTERSDSVILIDRSYSMRIAGQWRDAQQTALQRVAQKQALDRIAVVAFDDQTEVVSDLTDNGANLRSVIQRLSPGTRSTRLRLAIEQAGRLLAGSNARRRQILLISDFQAAGVTAGEIAEITRDIELVALPVDNETAANAGIESVSITASSNAAAEQISLAVKLANHSDSMLRRQLRLEINGRELARREVELAPASSLSETFTDINPGASLLRGVVSLDEDALALDNRRHFIYAPNRQIPLLIVDAPEPRANQSIYLERALALSSNPVFRVSRSDWSQLRAEDLSSWAVVILNDVPIPGGAMGDALQKFVAAGGGLLIALGEAVQGHWPSSAEGYLPATLSRRTDAKPGTAYSLAQFSSTHPLAARLGARANLDLSQARIFSYRELEPNARDRVLAYYGGGDAALLERRVGNGRTLVLGTTLDTHWNDLALQPAFLPFVHQLLNYLAAFEPYPERFEVGEVVDVMRYARALAGGDAIVAAGADSTLVVESPDAAEIRLQRRSPLLDLAQPGFYQVHRATPAGTEVVLAVNVDPAEANPNRLDVARFVEEIVSSASALPATDIVTRRQAGEFEQQQQLGYLILFAVLALLLAEAFAANRIAGSKSTRA